MVLVRTGSHNFLCRFTQTESLGEILIPPLPKELGQKKTKLNSGAKIRGKLSGRANCLGRAKCMGEGGIYVCPTTYSAGKESLTFPGAKLERRKEGYRRPYSAGLESGLENVQTLASSLQNCCSRSSPVRSPPANLIGHAQAPGTRV